MLVKALKSFAGIKVSMYEGEIQEVEDKDILSDLLNAGYIEEIKEAKTVKTEKKK